MTGAPERQAVEDAGTAATPQDRLARLAALSRGLVEADESRRLRLARELQEEIAQDLTALKIAIRLLAGQPVDPAALDEALGIADRVIHGVRALALELRPPVLDELGLEAALRWYAEQQGKAEGAIVDWALGLGEARPAPAVETACFRVAQQAMANALQHAGASRVRVATRRRGRGFELVVEDDGVGFDVPAAWRRASQGETVGLLAMDERAALVGGRLSVDSAPGRGTTVRAWFPLDVVERQG